jgi:hypothetical protein
MRLVRYRPVLQDAIAALRVRLGWDVRFAKPGGPMTPPHGWLLPAPPLVARPNVPKAADSNR